MKMVDKLSIAKLNIVMMEMKFNYDKSLKKLKYGIVQEIQDLKKDRRI